MKLIFFSHSNSENRLDRQRDIEWPEDDDGDTIQAEIDGIEVTPDTPLIHNCNFDAKNVFFSD